MRFCCYSLGHTFGNGNAPVRALKDVNFETKAGEFLSVVGPSGCGKTTLLMILAGLLAHSDGTVERMPSNGTSRALCVFQEHGLFPWMNVIDNACFGLEMQGEPLAVRRRAAMELLQRFGLEGREDAYPNHLSAGMKQRVAVIRAFISRPSALLMDEPFGALDYQTRLVLQRELIELWEQNRPGVVFVTHDIDEALLLSDRVILLSGQPGTVADEFRVPLPRPRRSEMVMEPMLLELKRRVLDQLALWDRG